MARPSPVDGRHTCSPGATTCDRHTAPKHGGPPAWEILATDGTPGPILAKFHAELVTVFNLPEVRTQLSGALGMDLAASSPAGLQKFFVSETARRGKVVREHNIRAE
jgi:tripartite-type tricarboxylate transporter receptor subunit TctC